MFETTAFFVKHFFQFHALVQKYHVVVQYCQIGNFQSGNFAPMHGIEKSVEQKSCHFKHSESAI